MRTLLEIFQLDFLRNVLAGTLLVAVLCSFLGVFIVLRRAVFVGAALAQVGSLGAALSFLVCALIEEWHQIEVHFPPQPSALLLTLMAAVLLAMQYRERRMPREATIGVAYAAASGIAILAVAASPHAQAEVLNLLFGNVLAIGRADVWWLAALVAVIGIIHWLFHKEFLFASFDPDMATALGVPARFWNIVLFLTIGMTIALTIVVAGALVVFGLLVLPAATALLIARNLRAVFVIAVAAGAASAVAGVAFSYVADLPTGPAIVASNAAILAVACALRPRA